MLLTNRRTVPYAVRMVKIPVVTCSKCRYEWFPRVPRPKRCPSCSRPLKKANR